MSKFTLIYTPGAVMDVKEAAKWYNDEQKGLGRRFREDVLKVIDKIEKNPLFASVKYSDIRTASCKTFPYSVHYKVDDLNKVIRILSVFHFSRKPKSSP